MSLLPFQIRAPEELATEPDASKLLSDRAFFDKLGYAILLREMIQEKQVKIDPRDFEASDLSDFMPYRFHRSGKMASAAEWKRIDSISAILNNYRTQDMIKELRAKNMQISIGIFPIIAMGILVLGFVTSILGVVFSEFKSIDDRVSVVVIVGYVGWTLALGALGACAFLAVNTLSVRNDASFDITNRALVYIRLSLGSVFAFVLGFPVSISEYGRFVARTATMDALEMAAIGKLLVPFVLGFSTSLVMSIMDRFVLSIASLFGLSGQANISGANGPPPAMPTPMPTMTQAAAAGKPLPMAPEGVVAPPNLR